jgi:hypothetical protein
MGAVPPGAVKKEHIPSHGLLIAVARAHHGCTDASNAAFSFN